MSTDIIKNLRKQKQLTQDDLARQLGVSRQTIFAIETGKSEPSLQLAIKLCSLLNSPLEAIFYNFFDVAQKDERRKEVNNMRELSPWTPLAELTDLHRDIDRFFEGAVQSSRSSVPSLGAMNIKDAGENYITEISIPGLNDDEIDIEAGDNFLTVKGEKKDKTRENSENYLRREFSHANFERTVSFSNKIMKDKINAKIIHGTLYITLPKIAPEIPKVTKVKVDK